MKKRIVSLLLLVVMCLGMLSLVACQLGSDDGKGDNGVQETLPPGEGYDGSEVTITFYHTMGQNLRDVLDAYIVEFNKLYPNIEIVHSQVGGYDDVRDQIRTEITVGNQPNIAYCYPDHVALYNLAKVVLTLDELISSTVEVTRADGSKEIMGLSAEQVADFIPGYYNEGKAFGDDKMYTLPLSKSTEVLYYNKTFFTENNLKVPTTWAEMEEVCKKIKEIDPSAIPLGYDSESNWFITMCEQYGSPYTSATGDRYLFANDTNYNFVEMFTEWYAKGYVTTKELSGAYTSDLFTATGSDAIKSYMSIGSTGGAQHQCPDKVDGEYPFEVGIATIPQVKQDAPKVISQGPSLCIFKKSNAQEMYASWLFVKFLTTNVEFQAEFSMVSGYSPVIKSVKDQPTYAEWLGKADGGAYITALSTKVCLEQENAYYVSPAFNGSSVARDQVGLLMQKCFSTCWTVGADKTTIIVDRNAIIAAFAEAVDECEYQS